MERRAGWSDDGGIIAERRKWEESGVAGRQGKGEQSRAAVSVCGRDR